MNKADHYSWAKPGDKGQYRQIPLSDLNVDHSYQRKEVSEPNTLAIAKAFDWSAFAAITVMERQDGTKWIVDGQQRYLAACRRGDISTVPCMLFHSDGRDHEANAFYVLNTRRKSVDSYTKFRALVSANVSPQRDVADFLKQYGCEVKEDNGTSKYIRFPTHLVEGWKKDCEAAKLAFVFCLSLADGIETISHRVFKGLWLLYHYGIDVSEHERKIREQGSLVGLMQGIKSVQIAMQQTEVSERTAALGILSVINLKRRNKIILPDSQATARE